jgi:two-component system, cell cycle response regulator
MRRPPREDLDALWGGPAAPDSVLAVFELVGFQPYHDSFGALAGAAMLERLYGRLAEAVRAWGRAYRLKPDRFAVLATVGERGPDAIVATADAALTEHGGAFRISPVHGMALMPSEADGPDAALRLADQRLYAARQRGGARGTRTRDALMAALEEARPALAQHMRAVGGLARQTGVELGLDPEALDELVRAAELHDVGKIAIPDEILDKSGPLSDDDWGFLRRHTVAGERILGAAAPLGPVAQLVRSSHERWDGSGYPDGLQGAEIPLGARVIAVCDAYDTMVSERHYSSALEGQAALAELRRSAGRQFDPRVVEAFVTAHGRRVGAGAGRFLPWSA